MVILTPPPYHLLQVPTNRALVTSTCTSSLWKPKMKYKYSLNAFCGCSDYIIGKEPCILDYFVSDTLAYMKSSLFESSDYVNGMMDKFENNLTPKELLID